ncbi:MAG: nucleotidyltransferase domain-containing protein [Candidatus Freyarchaeota archaeon]|nr:nucleotidyltransferase domain-containing protein [Candidatus Jordarchaeia archaeon]MBS7269413.1 nucleotidyltransferase domain-containing protein [Candidatus Jordarchaeia archaeon]MBS7280201.1 nucleotidyltransferase domain-containing protein [Candidatus Jordarchaeia archaeon]
MEEIRSDLKALSGLWVVVYGSWPRGEATPRSDIDVAVITRTEDKAANLKTMKNLLGKTPSGYDVRIFESFPLHIKAEVMSNYVVVFGDPLEISEYFYYYRRLWKDVEQRYKDNQFTSYKEVLQGIKRRKMLQGKLGIGL